MTYPLSLQEREGRSKTKDRDRYEKYRKEKKKKRWAHTKFHKGRQIFFFTKFEVWSYKHIRTPTPSPLVTKNKIK